jgi:hypothetical protein
MPVIQNKWVEKIKEKKKVETAPSFQSNPDDTWLPVATKEHVKRHTLSTGMVMKKTLRGVRK